MQLTEKYRPQRVADLVGQYDIRGALGAFTADPYSCAMLFDGDSGTGKTSAAMALANDLGVDLKAAEFGGLHVIASGEQTADSVRNVLRRLSYVPMYGSGWKVLVVNECDRMNSAAETIWLDALEQLPLHVVAIFTTNHADELSDRFRDRCERYTFASSIDAATLAEHALAIWRTETGELTTKPRVKAAAVIQNGRASLRRLVMEVARCIRMNDKITLDTAPGGQRSMFAAPALA